MSKGGLLFEFHFVLWKKIRPNDRLGKLVKSDEVLSADGDNDK